MNIGRGQHVVTTVKGDLSSYVPVAPVPVASVPVASVPVASVPVASGSISSGSVSSGSISDVPVAPVPVASGSISDVPVAPVPVASGSVASGSVASGSAAPSSVSQAQTYAQAVCQFAGETGAHFGQQALAVGVTTFGRQLLGAALEVAFAKTPLKTVYSILAVLQVVKMCAQVLRHEQLNRKPDFAARSLAGESPDQWVRRTGCHPGKTLTPTGDARSKTQLPEYKKSMAQLQHADLFQFMQQGLTTAVNFGLITYAHTANKPELAASILANEIKNPVYAVARDTIQATGRFISAHEETHGLSGRGYTQGAATYAATNLALVLAANQLTNAIKNEGSNITENVVILAASSALFNTVIETVDFQTMGRIEASHAKTTHESHEDRAQRIGLANSQNDYSRLLGQTPGRINFLDCSAALGAVIRIALETSTLNKAAKDGIAVVLTAIVAGGLHRSISPEWAAQAGGRGAVMRGAVIEDAATRDAGQAADTLQEVNNV